MRKWDCRNVKTTVNAKTCRTGRFGYFANDLDSLFRAVTLEKTNLRTVYGSLAYVLPSSNERRFGTETGHYALFYPMDRTFTRNRY